MDLTLTLTLGTLVGCFVGLSWFAGSDAPYVPSKLEKIKQALKLARLKKDDIFYELGSGDGRVVIEAAKICQRAVGIEQSWIRVLMSYKSAKKQHLSNTQFIHGNIFDKDLSTATVIFIYLLPQGVAKLETKLKSELSRGTRIITQTYHFPNLKPIQKDGELWLYKV